MELKTLVGKTFRNEAVLEKKVNEILDGKMKDMYPCQVGFLVRTKSGDVITLATTTTIGELEVLGVK